MTTATQSTRPRRRTRRPDWTARLRHISQATFVALIVFVSLRHGLAATGGDASTASIDALCPFGGLETLWRYITTGQFISKAHPSNLIIGLALLISVLLAGSAFCGWICPFGALHDGLSWLRKTLRLPEIQLPPAVDRWLRLGRYVTLALILYKTISTAKMWFAGYDPYRTLFSLEWLFDFNPAEHWPAYLIVVAFLVAGLLIPRFWCRYACPLGGAMSLLGHVSLLRIRRNPDSCKGCALCNTKCPVGIDVANAPSAVSTNCIGCLACVQTCPRGGALEVQLAPTWWDRIKGSGPAKTRETVANCTASE